MGEFVAFKRKNGQVGVRNHLAIVSTVVCSNVVASKIAAALGAEVVAHDTGCLQLGQDRQQTVDLLVGMATNPNVGSVLLIGLGCEQQPPKALLDMFHDAEIEHLTIQGSGGTEHAVTHGVEVGRRLAAKLEGAKRTAASWRDLTIAIRTSDELDATLEHVAPILGVAVNELVDRGSRVIVAETLPYVGLGAPLLERFASDAGREQWTAFERRTLDLLSESGWDTRSAVRRSGDTPHLSLRKLGDSSIQGLLEYGQHPPAPGLWLMQAPSDDLFAGPGMLRAGCNALIHGSSRGNLYSPPILPVVKICGDARTFAAMPDAYDLDASTSRDSLSAAADLLHLLEEVISGQATRAEEWHGQEIAIPRIGATL